MAKKNSLPKKRAALPTPSESEAEDFDDYNDEDDSGSVEDLAGRIRNDSGSDDQGEEFDDGSDIGDESVSGDNNSGSDDNEEDNSDLKKSSAGPKSILKKNSTTDEDDAAKSKREAEERKKKKRIEQLDKRIKKLMKKHEKEKEIKREPSDIKNKLKRQEVVVRKRQAKEEARVIERLKKKKVREELGEAAMPKGKTNTIESMRVADETLIEDAQDEDIKGEQEIDEFSSYFKNLTTPKILMTTNRRPKGGLFQFLKEIKEAIPSVEYYER